MKSERTSLSVGQQNQIGRRREKNHLKVGLYIESYVHLRREMLLKRFCFFLYLSVYGPFFFKFYLKGGLNSL